ncbi:MAG: outer membrane protein assembly factor BamD [Candidatus Acidiferrales bacterium]
MNRFLSRKAKLLIGTLGVSIFFGVCLDAGAQKKLTKKQQDAKKQQEDLANSAEPDKVLYDRAQSDLKHNRYTEGRLALQTLINTYPDSEYLAKAKLAVADSYFKEGGTSNLTQAISEYKDFETFFPFLDEAAYAQMQIGMSHFKMMEKADRETTQAQLAEDELQAMLLKYPQSPLAPKAEQRLREVQEVLADGEFRIAKFYYTKQDSRAAGARLMEVTDRYPLYSQNDEALWMLADIWMKAKLATKDEDLRNAWAAQAGKCYDRIITDYPLSKRAQDAKARLKSMGMPVPAPDPLALARMQKEQSIARDHHSAFAAFLNSPLGMLKSGPDVSTAAHTGTPNMTPPNDSFSASDIMKPSGASGMSVGGGAVGSAGGGSTPGLAPSTTPSGSAPGSGSTGPRTGAAVQIISPAGDATTAPTSDSAPEATPPTAAAPPASSPSGATATPAPPPEGTAPSSTPQPASTPQGNDTTAPGAAPSSPQGGLQSTPQATDPKDESTSKKKKGLRKLVPW